MPDCIAAEPLLDLLPPEVNIVQADKGYDSNAVERMFGGLKDFRRIFTRHDRRAYVYLSAIHLAATVTYWL